MPGRDGTVMVLAVTAGAALEDCREAIYKLGGAIQALADELGNDAMADGAPFGKWQAELSTLQDQLRRVRLDAAKGIREDATPLAAGGTNAAP